MTVIEQNLNYIKTIWTLLIANGGALVDDGVGWGEDINYYGNCLNIDEDLTKDIAEVLSHTEPVWEELQDPAERTGYGFKGTFTDEQYRIPYLVGDLILPEHMPIRWGCVLPNDSSSGSFSGLLKLLIGTQISYQDAVEKLLDRVTGQYFRFSCEMKL